MIPEIGALGLMAAFVASAFGAVAAPLGARRGRPELVRAAQGVAYATFGLVAAAAGLLEAALVGHDFSVRFVAETTNRSMPTPMLVASLWGGQAGSLLYWCLALCGLAAAATWWVGRRHPALHADALGALLAVELFFLGAAALLSNPFQRSAIVPIDGRGLNPLLMDDGMQVHPPMLLAGYASFAVPFALAIAGLAAGRLDDAWRRALRPWVLLSWTLQGCGLLLGAWWAYHVLGWGGYWGWDPVENAALLPWLVATALLHSLLAQEHRGSMPVWNVAMALTGLCLAVFGTFAVRSGILSSVHSFAESPLGPVFLGFLAVVLLGSVLLVVVRLPLVRANAGRARPLETLASREAAIQLNNLLLVGAAAATFWGTIVPLLSEALRGVRIAVGAPFYQAVNGPICLALLLLLAVGPQLGWRRTPSDRLRSRMARPVVAAAVVAVGLLVFGVPLGLALAGWTAAALVVATVVVDLARDLATPDPFAAFARRRRRHGAYLVHLAIALVAVGVVGSSWFQQEATAALRPGETTTVGGYTLAFAGLDARPTGYGESIAADLSVRGPGGTFDLRPERRAYFGSADQATTGVAIRTTLPRLDDVYVVLTGWEDDGSVQLHVFVNPLVSTIWLGGAVLLFGTALLAWPAAARRPSPAAQPETLATPALAEA